MKKLIRLLDRDRNARVLWATLCRQGDRFVLSFCARRSAKQRQTRQPDAVVGVDVGLKQLATLQTDDTSAQSRPLQVSQRRLRVLQPKLDRQRRADTSRTTTPGARAKNGTNQWERSDRQIN